MILTDRRTDRPRVWNSYVDCRLFYVLTCFLDLEAYKKVYELFLSDNSVIMKYCSESKGKKFSNWLRHVHRKYFVKNSDLVSCYVQLFILVNKVYWSHCEFLLRNVSGRNIFCSMNVYKSRGKIIFEIIHWPFELPLN